MAHYYENKRLCHIKFMMKRKEMPLILILSSYIFLMNIDLHVHANDTEIILDDDDHSSFTNRSNTFYSLDTNTTGENNITVLEVENEATIDDFWDSPSPPLINNTRSTTIFPTVPTHTTTFMPPIPSFSWSTLPPPFTNIRRTSPFATNKPKLGTTTSKEDSSDSNSESENTIAENIGRIWKIVLHGTNMNSEELRMCNKTLIENHFKQSSRRKVARNMKRELEKIFSKWNYRFSILVSSTSRNTMGKALHGVWMSISINGIHYFITATHGVKDGPKIKEEQMEKIEYWAHVHAIGARNMTGYRKYNRIAQKLKIDLDRFYGHGNVWSVVIVKNPLLVKAKIFEDPEYHIEFRRLNGGHFIIFRGGQNIDDGNRHARDLLIPESDDNTLESETEHEDYRNNIYLMTTW